MKRVVSAVAVVEEYVIGSLPAPAQDALAADVCVCVYVYYTPFSSVARGVPYLLQGMMVF